VSTLPLTCDQLLSAATVTGLFATPVSLRQDQDASPGSFIEVAARQAGGLHCVWGGGTGTDNGYDSTVVLSVIPNGVADYGANSWTTVDGPDVVVDTAGDHSRYSCDAPNAQFLCKAELLVGQYWVSMRYANGADPAPSAGTPAALLQGVLERLTTAIRSASSPRAAFHAPANAWSGSGFCAADGLGRVRAAFGAPALASRALQFEGPYDAQLIAVGRSPLTQCGWGIPNGEGSSVTGVDVEVIPGAAWALREQLAKPPSDYYYGTQQPTTIARATAATIACNSIDCEAFLSVDSSWVDISVEGGGTNPAATTTQIAALLAATPRA
jgi:hypothetical protein